MKMHLKLPFFVLVLVISDLLWTGDGALILTMLMRDLEDNVCFEVKDETSNVVLPKVALVLQVEYPTRVAEAGEIILEGPAEGLTLGNHTLSYKYTTTNMTHDLKVKFDGKDKKFLKAEVPRWSSVSRFHEVAFLIEGTITIQPCPDKQIIEEESNPRFHDTFKSPGNDDTRYTSFLKEESNVTQSSSNIILNSTNDMKLPSSNESKLLNDPNSLNNLNSILKTENERHDSHNLNPGRPLTPTIGAKPSISKQSHIGQREDETNAVFYDDDFASQNYSHFDWDRSEAALECLTGECSDQFSHDYTIVLILVGVLGCLFVVALVVSVVFHVKKKKLMASARAQPQNRLRQQIQEEMASAESPLVLQKIEASQEDIP